MKKILAAVVVACLVLSPASFGSQTHRKTTSKRSSKSSAAAAAAAAAQKQAAAAEVQAARTLLAAQIKSLTQFLFLLGGISKGIDSVDEANRNHDASPQVVEQNERNRAKVRESIKNMHDALSKIELTFHNKPTLANYSYSVNGLGRIGEAAEKQAAANRFDEAGRSLVSAVNQLTDALTSLH
jgi:hypothetical protein